MSDLKVGTSIEAMENLDLRPYAVISRGETGRVTKIEEVFGNTGVTVRFDNFHPGLKLWDNEALLVPPETAYLAPVGNVVRRCLAAALGGGVIGVGLVKANAFHFAGGALMALLGASGLG